MDSQEDEHFGFSNVYHKTIELPEDLSYEIKDLLETEIQRIDEILNTSVNKIVNEKMHYDDFKFLEGERETLNSYLDKLKEENLYCGEAKEILDCLLLKYATRAEPYIKENKIETLQER